jgi:hypothetical protein
MASHRVLKLFVVATVLAAAWYAGSQAGPGMAIPVAIVGLAAAHWQAVLGIPVAIAMAAAAVYVPGVAIGATVVVAFLAIVSAYVNAALRDGQIRGSSVTPGDGNVYFGMSVGDFDGGGCDGGF